MDVDPLQDVIPPRYAIESDEEEDELNPLRSTTTTTATTPSMKIVPEPTTGLPLVIAAGLAGTFWSKGADLREQAGAVFVNDIQVGMVFKPDWTESTILVSEALSRLPLSYMHPYASSVLESFSPSGLSILDVYSTVTYSTPEAPTSPDAPLRYLSTSDSLSLDIDRFQPPNLLQSTTAAFLADSLQRNIPSTAILLPYNQLLHPAPKDLHPANITHLEQDNNSWSTSDVQKASTLLFQALGQKPAHTWQLNPSHKPLAQSKRKLGDSSMYI